jgi:hypothetical protein
MKTQFEEWLDKVNVELKEHYETYLPQLNFRPLTYIKGNNYIKIVREGSVWGFVSMVDNSKKGEKVGDLLKAASWKAPAKIPRGNIFDGTAKYSVHGPEYLK